jgi:hypothetical protein
LHTERRWCCGEGIVSEAPPKDAVTNPSIGPAKPATQTVPDVQQSGIDEEEDRGKALLLYGTDTVYPLVRRKSGIKYSDLGADPTQDIVISSPYVSARHCRIYPIRLGVKVVDQKSKNGTSFEGRRRKSFEAEAGKSFFVGARSHQLVVLNERMRVHYPALASILGYEDEHLIPSETPSPSELIVATVDGPHVLITSEPHCEQEQLARILHDISLLRDRPLVPFEHAPGEHDAQFDSVQHRAATVLLKLGDHEARLPPTFASRLFSWRYRTRVIALAASVEVANAALGARYVKRMKHIWLEPLSGRGKAIQRLLDITLRSLGAELRVAAMTSHNQAALRSHRWADNFESLREAARRLAQLAQHGTIRSAARALDMNHGTLGYWYSDTMRMKLPLLGKTSV